jgi:hypothetical protein
MPKSDYRRVLVGYGFVGCSYVGQNESQTRELSDLEGVDLVQTEKEEMVWMVHWNGIGGVYDESMSAWKGADQGVDWWEIFLNHADRASKVGALPEVKRSFEWLMQGRRKSIDRQQQTSPTPQKEIKRMFRPW